MRRILQTETLSVSIRFVATIVAFVLLSSTVAFAQGDAGTGAAPPGAEGTLDFRDMIRAGGAVGLIIILLSVAMVALIVEHAMSIRRGALIPPGLGDTVHKLIGEKRFKQADRECKDQPSFLGRVLSSGLAEVGLGYPSVEKSMESTAHEQSARLFRKIEFLSVIGTIAPMLGLLGTVWGMILAFVEFESKANPQVSELAPGIYKALVTTLLGLGVAVPALTAFAIFRNRIDEFVAEASLTAETAFGDFKRGTARSRGRETGAAASAASAPVKATSAGGAQGVQPRSGRSARPEASQQRQTPPRETPPHNLPDELMG